MIRSLISGFGSDTGLLSSWSVATSGTSSIILNTLYENNSFVAVCRGSLRSVDGISWTLTNTSTAYPSGFYGLAYGAGVWVAGTLGDSPSYRIFTSTDNGTTWTGRSSPFGASDGVQSITYGNGVFVAYGGMDSYKLATSTNGTTWTNRTLPTGLTSNDVAYVSFVNGKFFMTNTYPRAYISTTGTSWTAITGGIIPTSINIVYGNGIYVMLGNSSGYGVATSTNGTTWVTYPNAIKNAGITTNVDMRDITYADGLFVAVGNLGTVLTSEDGINWTKKTSPNFGTTYFYSVCYGNGKFVITGSGGKILYATL